MEWRSTRPVGVVEHADDLARYTCTMQRMFTMLAGAALAACGSQAPTTGTLIQNHAEPRPLDTSIRSVDFLNHTYHSSLGDGDGEDVTVKGGDLERGNDEDGNSMGFFHVGAPIYGDVDGDGIEDAIVVTVDNGGGTGMFDAAHVYTMRKGEVVELATIPGGDRGDGGIQSIEVARGGVKVTRNLSVDGDGACCPSKLQIESWRWDGSDLALDEHTVQTVPNADAPDH
jgi:hypothetical protein